MTNGKSPCPIGTFHFQEQIHLHSWWIFPWSWYCHVSFLRFRCRDFQEFALLELPKHSWNEIEISWNILYKHESLRPHWGSYCWWSNSRLKLLGMHTTYTTTHNHNWNSFGIWDDLMQLIDFHMNFQLKAMQWISHEVSGDFSSCTSIGWNVMFL